ncbi:uncharacterized protein LOC130387614 isoform X3 [Gadus chalcogrammus]|uniref:uncharacterized protein LOC130387614 isoform X3 n=1 Tax=Gadus chalcogrammus TaxID=1042646 RepID=UPI0024C4A3A3|nr:uncharacterized protein LOC130387614 isoform X3 [Gadus chalcogrammus]
MFSLFGSLIIVLVTAMATNHCANRPPQSSQPGLNQGTQNPHPNAATGAPNPQPQGPPHGYPGMYSSQDYQPGQPCAPHPHFPPHPFMYMPPAPHPPPMTPFPQWPSPYSYNPFSGFPGMGYGMVMPPFPPNPYLEAPLYMLPQPHFQQLNYRRLIHSQFPGGNAPYQSQNRRLVSQPNSGVRETVSSEVQTEPTADASPRACSESGNGTRGSTTPSDFISGKQSQVLVEHCTAAVADAKGHHNFAKKDLGRGTAKRGQASPLSAQIGKRSCGGQEKSSCRLGSDGETWSMCAANAMIPVCSSSDREDEVTTKERRVSFPDVLMTLVGGTPPVVTPESPDAPSPKRGDQLAGQEVALAKEIRCDSLTTKSKNLEDDIVLSHKEREDLAKIIGSPFYFREDHATTLNTLNDSAVLVDSIVADIHSRNGMSQNTPIESADQSQKVPDNELVLDEYEESALHEDAMQDPFSGHFQFKRKMDESVWSVESLAAYVPSPGWMMQNGLLDPEVIIEEILEDVQKRAPSTQSCNPTVHPRDRRLSRRFSLSANAFPVYIPPATWSAEHQHLIHSNAYPPTTQRDEDTSVPAETLDPQTCGTGVPTPSSKEAQLQRDQGIDPSNAHASLLDETSLAVDEGGDMDESSEAVRSPTQKPCRVTERAENSPCSSKQVEAPLSNTRTENESPSSRQIREQELNGRVETNSAKNEQLAVEIPKNAVSPAKSDCGSQCSLLQHLTCICNCHQEAETIQASSETAERKWKQTKKNRPNCRRNRQKKYQKETWMGDGMP